MSERQGGWLSGVTWRLAPENSGGAIRTLSLVWFALVVLQALDLLYLVHLNMETFSALFIVPCGAAAGYFLRSRKSRAVAVAMAIDAVLSASEASSTDFDTLNKVLTGALGVLFVLVAWRAVAATWVFQRARHARIRWLRVVLIPLGAVLGGFVSGIAVVLTAGHGANAGQTDFIVGLGAFAGFALTFALLTYVRPLATAAAEENVAQVFS